MTESTTNINAEIDAAANSLTRDLFDKMRKAAVEAAAEAFKATIVGHANHCDIYYQQATALRAIIPERPDDGCWEIIQRQFARAIINRIVKS